MGTTAADAVNALLASLGHNTELDAEVMDYLVSVAEDPDPESSLDLLISVLTEYLPAFAALDSDNQTQLVLQLLDDVSSRSPNRSVIHIIQLQRMKQACCLAQVKLGAHAGVSSTATDADDNGVHAVIAALRQAKLQCHEDVGDPCSDITNTRAAGSRSSSSDSSTSKGPDLGPLLELCPAGISSQFVQHCLQHNLQGDMQASTCASGPHSCSLAALALVFSWAMAAGSCSAGHQACRRQQLPCHNQLATDHTCCLALQAAANWLLETDPAQLMRQQQAWERDAEQRERERQEAERQKRQQKKAIVEK